MSRSITIEDLYRFKFLSRPRLSPDGRRVAFVVTTIDEHAHAYRSAIWMMPANGGEATRFVGGMYNAQSPVWSPDGRWLAFVSNREGEGQDKKRGKDKPQIWLLPTDGGEARQLTFMPHGANNPTWSPDGARLLFTALTGPLDEEGEDGKPLPKVRVIDRTFYRLDGTGFIHERRQHLFLIDASGGEPRQLTDGDWDDKDAAWSPDGQHIAFTSNRQDDRWFYPCYDLYTLAITDDQAKQEPCCLTDGSTMNREPTNCVSPSWSPDGQRIAFLGSSKYRSGGQVEVFTIAANGAPDSLRNLTEGFEGSCADWTNSDMTNEQLRPPPIWSPDRQMLYALAVQRGSTRVYAIPVCNGAAGDGAASNVEAQSIVPVTFGNIHALDFSMDAARQQMAVLIETPAHPSEIFMMPMDTPGEFINSGAIGETDGRPQGSPPRPTTTPAPTIYERGALRRLTTFNDALFDELTLTAPEYFSYTGADGWPMDGWVLKPPDFDQSRKYPLIVEIHGGPHTQYGYGFMHEMHMLAAQGYVVLFTNPRGSLGYGRDFALAVRGAWAEKDSLDILAGMDAVIQHDYIDEQRLGVIGGSYGGFMTAWFIGHSDRFKAAVSDRPVINRASFFGSSDIGIEFADDDLETVPWEDLPRHMHTSPIAYVKNMHTPLLIIHSEHDLRCNIEQSEQLFAALKYLGREVLFVRFEGQSHGLSRSGHPHSRLERLRHIKQWFAEHL